MKKALILFLLLLVFTAFSSDNGIYPVGTKVINGQIITTMKTGDLIPFSVELLGVRAVLPADAYLIGNYVDGKKNGLFVCYTAQTLFYTACYENDMLNGEMTLFPNGIFSVSAIVKENVLDGKCTAIFQPYKYCYTSKAETIGTYDMKKVGVQKSKWITIASPDFCMTSSGIFRSGKRFEGEFLSLIQEIDLRIVSVLTFNNYKLIRKTEPLVFKLKPYQYNVIKP